MDTGTHLQTTSKDFRSTPRFLLGERQLLSSMGTNGFAKLIKRYFLAYLNLSTRWKFCLAFVDLRFLHVLFKSSAEVDPNSNLFSHQEAPCLSFLELVCYMQRQWFLGSLSFYTIISTLITIYLSLKSLVFVDYQIILGSVLLWSSVTRFQLPRFGQRQRSVLQAHFLFLLLISLCDSPLSTLLTDSSYHHLFLFQLSLFLA